ncbi:hypothetical protein HanRHA438_Chr13g0583161 [Helianthus annuus]|nr:hypothetical protein HanRHA438_Chr13g0583161 [Helianthus annuus]
MAQGHFRRYERCKWQKKRANQRPPCSAQCAPRSFDVQETQYLRTPTWHQSQGRDTCPTISTYLLMAEGQ